MAEHRSDRIGSLWLVALTIVTWLMVLVLQGCAGSGARAPGYDALLASALTFCTEQCLPFGVLDAGLGPSPDGTSPFSCECMPAGLEIPDEEPERNPEDRPSDKRAAKLQRAFGASAQF